LELIEANWSGIERVAKALQTHRALTQAEVDSLMALGAMPLQL